MTLRAKATNPSPYAVCEDTEARALKQQLDDSTPETAPAIDKQYRDLIIKKKSESFNKLLSQADPANTTYWKLVQSIYQAKNPLDDMIIEIPDPNDGDSTIKLTTNKQKANAFIRHYSMVGGYARTPNRVHVNTRPPPVTVAEFKTVKATLRCGKAAGIDKIAADVIKNLPAAMAAYLHDICNDSIQSGTIPNEWKTGIIIPVPKPDKDHKLLGSYRPITLTPAAAKLCERIVANRLLFYVQPYLEQAQYGYLRTRTTGDAIFDLLDFFARGADRYEPRAETRRDKVRFYASPNRTFLTLYDMTAAFDRVDIGKLIGKLERLKVPAGLRLWIRNFLWKRTYRVRIDGSYSRTKTFCRGVPQGTILGPLLFLVYVNDLLKLLREKEHYAIMYADDLTLAFHGRVYDDIHTQVIQADELIKRWSDVNNMQISKSKTIHSLLAGHKNENPQKWGLDPDATDGQGPIRPYNMTKRNESTKILGAILDMGAVFNAHVESVVRSCKARINQLRCWASARHGASTHALRTFYLNYIESKILYACETWGMRLSPAQMKKLMVLQRQGLRVVTGCIGCTRAAHLYNEARITPLSTTIERRCFRKYEKDRRYPAGDRRHTLATQVIPPVAVIGSAKPPKQIVEHDCANRERRKLNTGANAIKAIDSLPREAVATKLPWNPAKTQCSELITFGTNTDRDVSVNDKENNDTLALKQAKYAASIATLDRLRSPPQNQVEIWTDASGRSRNTSGAYAIYEANTPCSSPIATMKKSFRTGDTSCSFRAEALTILRALRDYETMVQASPESHRDQHVLLVTDSRSTISALSGGPILQKENFLYDIWRVLLTLAQTYNISVHFQFIYSHCGVDRNEYVDALAGQHIDRYARTPDNITPTWLTDVCTMYKRHSKPTLHPFRQPEHPSWELKPRRLPKLSTSLTRHESTEFARLRSEAHPDFGIAPRLHGRVANMACRFCRPDLHPKAGFRPDDWTLVIPKEFATPMPCVVPGCSNTFTQRHLMTRHYMRKHHTLSPWLEPHAKDLQTDTLPHERRVDFCTPDDTPSTLPNEIPPQLRRHRVVVPKQRTHDADSATVPDAAVSIPQSSNTIQSIHQTRTHRNDPLPAVSSLFNETTTEAPTASGSHTLDNPQSSAAEHCTKCGGPLEDGRPHTQKDCNKYLPQQSKVTAAHRVVDSDQIESVQHILLRVCTALQDLREKYGIHKEIYRPALSPSFSSRVIRSFKRSPLANGDRSILEYLSEVLTRLKV